MSQKKFVTSENNPELTIPQILSAHVSLYLEMHRSEEASTYAHYREVGRTLRCLIRNYADMTRATSAAVDVFDDDDGEDIELSTSYDAHEDYERMLKESD